MTSAPHTGTTEITVAKYPIIGSPREVGGEWVVTVERAPDDSVTKTFANRAEARETAKTWRAAARILIPRGGVERAGAEVVPIPAAPRTREDLIALLSRTIQLSQAGEMPYSAVQPTIQMVKLQLKLLDMKDPEEDLTQLTEEELLDRIFCQLTTAELLELAQQRLDLRKMEVAA